MSFFGFDPNEPPHMRKDRTSTNSYDFQETYDGLGEELDEADDAFNDETFGVGEDLGKDFDFGATAGISRPSNTLNSSVSYANAVSQPSNDDEFMQDLWGASHAPTQTANTTAQDQQAKDKKIFSLEEIESQLTSMDPIQHQASGHMVNQPYAIPGMMPPPPSFGGYMMPPGNFLPGQQFQGHFGPLAPGVMPPQMQMPAQQAPHSADGQNLSHLPKAQISAQPQTNMATMQPVKHHVSAQANVQNQPTSQRQPSVQQQVRQNDRSNHTQQSTGRRMSQKVDFSNFPVLGSKEGEKIREGHKHKYQTSQQPELSLNYSRESSPNVSLTPEQHAKLTGRQEKVARIMKYSGIMNPKDKDFVTRFQLSQIVTEDPYNEDFYAQVFKVIHPKNTSISQAHVQHSEQHNSIAQAYLDQSGHRLGGRYKRADVALQRMQQQVQKAVTVAKERPKLTQYAREGALGKISIGNGKKPRQQLEIFSKAVQENLIKEEQNTSSNSDGKDKGEGKLAKTLDSVTSKVRSVSLSNAQASTAKYGRKDIMNILETIISNLMNLESESRLSSEVDTSLLWNSLHILDHPSTSGAEKSEVNPFIQCLNHAKALRILPRLFKFLNREQILTIVTLIMSNLENLSVIKDGSYSSYADSRVPENVLKLVEAYTFSFNKILINAAQDFRFNEIIGLLIILIEHNNVSFISTTKIGLTILTTLLSRAELIKGEGTISATDLSEWSACYDELFTSLESKIGNIFPPHLDEADDDSSRDSYVWQFLATLSLGGKLNHQRIIVDEVRDEIFGVMNRAKALVENDPVTIQKKSNLLNNLNMYLVVMGLVADENEIKEI